MAHLFYTLQSSQHVDQQAPASTMLSICLPVQEIDGGTLWLLIYVCIFARFVFLLFQPALRCRRDGKARFWPSHSTGSKAMEVA